MDVPEGDTTAAQLSSTKPSVGCTGSKTATKSQLSAKNTVGGEAAEVDASDRAATTAQAAPAAEGSAQTNTGEAQPPASSGKGGAPAAGEKKIPPGAVRMLSMTTVQEFQKKVAERRGRLSNH